MKESLESFRRGLMVCLVSAIIFGSVLTISAIFALAPPAEAATGATVHRSVPAMPPGMQRVTVTSNPSGATIYIDGIQLARTPMSFPMPPGRYTLILLAPGHQQYGRRILVPNAPLEIDANLIPNK